MPTLYLMRHADAAAGTAGGGDHGRPLTPRGVAEAAAVGRMLAARGLGVDLALVSTARRAQETFAALRAALAPDLVALDDGDLYGAEAAEILSVVRAMAGNAERVLVVGHNPGIGALAAALARGAGGNALRSFGTATVAVFTIDARDWNGLSRDSVSLRDVITPADFA